MQLTNSKQIKHEIVTRLTPHEIDRLILTKGVTE